MQKHELNEIHHALKQYSGEITGKITELEERMDERFERLETKFNSTRAALIETQETVDFLSGKTVQHEKQLRKFLYQ
ncbi:hypothetical protein BME96_15805 [Virgibacillus halodenitrificans]|uniref:Uncharacterized protein n=1 Tax=Virgibacillus halodenitrificans TaxID=1482 RepID=A0AAC9NM18_VIRHA|nr:hypothetical protein [Virgibacillus halodenitrificans]APC49568.1 hypothetical protein BME96_15805 [Virgibacillus halodenitrificans]